MPIFYLNKNPAGKLGNMLYGAACLFDGAVRILSLGWVATTAQLSVARMQARNHIDKLKKRREAEQC